MGNSQPHSKGIQQKAGSFKSLVPHVVTCLSLQAGKPLGNAGESVKPFSHSHAGQSTSLDENSKSCLGETLL